MLRKVPFLYNLLQFLLAQGQIQLVQSNFGPMGRPLVLNTESMPHMLIAMVMQGTDISNNFQHDSPDLFQHQQD